MLFQEGDSNPFLLDEVGSPKGPGFISAPESFFIELGRNKLKSNGFNSFIRNEYREVNFLTIEECINNYIQMYPDWGLYQTAFQYNKQDPYVSDLRGDFYLDFDDEEDIGKAQEDALYIIRHLTDSPNYKIESNMIRVYFSGKKGIHLIVPYQVFGIDWHPHLDQIYKIMAEELSEYAPNKTLDMKVYERRRLFRIPGSRHPSTGSYKVPMELSTLLTKTEEEIQELSKDPNYGTWIKYKEAKVMRGAARYFEECEYKFTNRYRNSFDNKNRDTSLDYDPKEYLELIEQGPTKGCRNEVASILTTFWRRRGRTEQEAWDLLVDWNNGSLSERELRTIFKSNFNGPYTYSLSRVRQYIQ